MAALTKKPSFKVATTAEELRQQRENLTKTINKGGAAADAAKANLAKVKTALISVNKAAAAPTQTPLTPQQQGYNSIVDQANSAQSNLINQIGAQGAFTPPTNIPITPFQSQAPQIQQFSPGDFQNTYNTAYGNVLNEFNRNNADTFKQQEQDFNQFAAERGLDPNSEAATKLYKTRISDVQTNARQAAQNSAVQAGLSAQNQAYGQNLSTYGQNLSAQNQGFGQDLSSYGQNLAAQGQQYGQAANTYQMPYQNLSALNPYFAAQAQGNLQNSQNQFNAGQATQGYAEAAKAAAQRFEYDKYLQQHQKTGGGGGGGALSFDQQMSLQNNASANQLNNALIAGSLSGGQQPNPYNNAIAGASQGFAAGITNSLLQR